MEKANQKTVLITGCDVPGSYGYELSLLLDKQGYNVFAGCTDSNTLGARSLASRGSENLAILQIDVTSEENVSEAVEMMEDSVGDEGVWAVVNCSETYVIAEIDWCSTQDFQNVINVNLMGTVRVTKALLPLVQKSRGRIINLSSSSGLLSRAGQSAYSASKFAIEAFSDSLRQEMHKWGVFVSVVEPLFLPDAEEALSSSATAQVLSRIPEDKRKVYGSDYFGSYIQSSLKDIGASDEGAKLPKSLELSDRGYHTWKKEEAPSNLRKRASTLPQKTSYKSNEVVTLTRAGGCKLSRTNRVLHALMDAVTSSTPKVRYFVGSVYEQAVICCGRSFPTAFVDTYMTYGAISNVVPQRVKEKFD